MENYRGWKLHIYRTMQSQNWVCDFKPPEEGTISTTYYGKITISVCDSKETRDKAIEIAKSRFDELFDSAKR